MASAFQVGQRWMSETEPELGLGAVEQCTDRTVTLKFRASDEVREYSLEHAPLRRVRFKVGDRIQLPGGATTVVETVRERTGVVFYGSNGRQIPESELDDHISFSGPEERLRHGQTDPSSAFDLRLAALEQQYHHRKSPVRGFVGGRIELIPHQLSVAVEAAGRLAPRVLLADEVGLGKTIEACLVLHRWLQTGLGRRVLVLVPEALVHQWFVELLRRFSLWFHIFDAERCEAIESANPFLDDQLVLCSIQFLAADSKRAKQVVQAGWDMVVVDEAHHLGWAPQAASPEYALVEALAAQTPALLLLTGTPEQLGLTSHFARLRLLDPDRYSSLEEFLHETERFQEVAAVAGKLINRQKLTEGDVQILARILVSSPSELEPKLKDAESAAESGARAELLDALIDRHGTGRVMFRNTRAVLGGFPRRLLNLQALAPGADAQRLFVRLADEFAADNQSDSDAVDYSGLGTDPRLTWLADLLRRLASEKVLLICRSQAKVLAIQDALRGLLNVKAAIFHEALPLVQRDRNAAWFAEEDGAQILLASEIGSEGRNFQFAHHLVLFDLPADPDLLEQRIGRLDRIGQRADIQIHVPFVQGGPQEVLARWFHEGLNAFETNLRGGRSLFERFGARVHDLAQDFHETQEHTRTELDQLITETRAAAATVAHQLEQGRDRLLELNSYRPAVAQQAVQAIAELDQDRRLEEFLLTVFDHFNIQVEELAARTYFLGSAGVFADSFPGLPPEGIRITFDRRRALAREDFQFLTWDHPLVTGALDLILGSPLGNASVAVWPQPTGRALYLETIFLLETVAPSRLHVDRFLPPTPIRIVVDHRGQDATARVATTLLRQQVRSTQATGVLDEPELRDELLPRLLEACRAQAQQQLAPLVQRARAEMNSQLGRELVRLRELRKVNRNVTAAEIELMEQYRRELDQHLADARLRLDALRLILPATRR